MKFSLITLLLAIWGTYSNSQNIPHTICNNCWNSDSLGNHRIVVRVTKETEAATAIVPWARMDAHPEQKGIIISDSATERKVSNIFISGFSRDTAIISFEPIDGPGIYYIYYLPFRNTGSVNYPTSKYLPASYHPDQKWIQRLNEDSMPHFATVERFEAIDSFNSFYPMEIKATDKKVNELLRQNAGKGFIVFPEHRLYSIRNKAFIPERWIKSDRFHFKDTAARGENFAYQLGIYALKNLKNIKVKFETLKSKNSSIPASKMVCINTTGVSYDAKPFLP